VVKNSDRQHHGLDGLTVINTSSVTAPGYGLQERLAKRSQDPDRREGEGPLNAGMATILDGSTADLESPCSPESRPSMLMELLLLAWARPLHLPLFDSRTESFAVLLQRRLRQREMDPSVAPLVACRISSDRFRRRLAHRRLVATRPRRLQEIGITLINTALRPHGARDERLPGHGCTAA
jgi:hypothetical protein